MQNPFDCDEPLNRCISVSMSHLNKAQYEKTINNLFSLLEEKK